ncbi:molybdopterin-binding protein [Roseitranquillus sediminis]|uniref:molybdopterin-binding protein n=1 Tax=Roseitranquillus sediminis TaxID=2809051 RepID=UPI001D0C42C6|nr:molybdopterin-binding protein [Roseitranquillus sediminis]MBM9594254.1 molybdopterin-binding protein [Roseitranquillus sediminis]
MRFGEVPLGEAEGAILAHSVEAGGARLRKGRLLGPDDLQRLGEAGVTAVTVARLEPGDLGEDAAATAVAQALVPDPAAAGLRVGRAATGRVNLHAEGPGILLYDPAHIHALNRVEPMITFAVLPPFAATRARMLVGTVKIISYAVPQSAVDAAVHHAERALRIAPVRLATAALIETEIGAPGPAKGEAAMRRRLEVLGMTLSDYRRVPHREDELAEALAEAEADLVLILTASATSDPHDVGPEAVRRAGGRLTRFGMPVDPGNLLFLGQIGERPVIGLPGCARSPALNGADWVLERVACGVEVSHADIAAMGVGGLLKEIPARGRPRES